MGRKHGITLIRCYRVKFAKSRVRMSLHERLVKVCLPHDVADGPEQGFHHQGGKDVPPITTFSGLFLFARRHLP